MSRATSLVDLFKHSLILCAVFSLICSLCYATPNKVSDESLIVKYIIEEGTKGKLKRNPDRMKEIANFAYGKALEFAKHNKEFAEDVFLDNQNQKPLDELDINKIDENNYLIELPLFLHPYQTSGCLFLINPAKPDWAPLFLEVGTQEGSQKSYSFIVDNIAYNSPLLLISARSAGWYAGLHTENIYVFKEGAFKLILSEETAVDEKKAEGVNLENENVDIEKYLKTTIHYIAHDIAQLYAKFASKKDEGLEKSDNWEKNIFC